MHNAGMSEIQKLRTKLGMNQTEFAKIIGVNQGTVSRWEAGKGTPGENEMIGIRVKVDSFLASRAGVPIKATRKRAA